jgi:hypothetical protein
MGAGWKDDTERVFAVELHDAVDKAKKSEKMHVKKTSLQLIPMGSDLESHKLTS